MKSTERTIDQLTVDQRELLARFYDTPTYNALKHLLELERFNTATKLVDINPTDIVAVARHQGRADACKKLHLTIKANYKENIKLEKTKNKKTKKS